MDANAIEKIGVKSSYTDPDGGLAPSYGALQPR